MKKGCRPEMYTKRYETIENQFKAIEAFHDVAHVIQFMFMQFYMVFHVSSTTYMNARMDK